MNCFQTYAYGYVSHISVCLFEKKFKKNTPCDVWTYEKGRETVWDSSTLLTLFCKYNIHRLSQE